MPDIKVGDRVRLTRDYLDFPEGTEGTVKGVDSDWFTYPVLVKWDGGPDEYLQTFAEVEKIDPPEYNSDPEEGVTKYPSETTPGVWLEVEGGPEGAEFRIFEDGSNTFAAITLDKGQIINLLYDLEQLDS
jgi:hypothetical protein